MQTDPRLEHIAPFQVMRIMARANELAAAGGHVVHLEVGEPDFPTAAPVAEAGARSIREGDTRYTEALGKPALRASIASYYAREIGVAVDPARIAVTAGASGGLVLLNALLLGAGDELLITDPGYPCNSVFAQVVGARSTTIPLRAEQGWQLTADAVAAAWRPETRGVLFASPANPTGVVAGRDELAGVVAAVADRGGFVIVDEIYQGLVYEDPGYRSVLQLVDDEAPVLVLNSFSKYFGMTGWLVVPPSCVDAVERLAQNLFIAPSTIAQHAALEAFSPAAMAIHEERRRLFMQRRDRLLGGLLQLGLDVPVTPSGAFYLYADVAATGLGSGEFCERLLEEALVAVTPGADFAVADADRYVRFAYTVDETEIDVALDRLKTFLATL